MKISISDTAKQMLADKAPPGSFLRILVVEGGCAGMTYKAEIGQDIQSGEQVVLEDGDARVISDQESLQFLDGLHIDYSDDLLDGGLKFTNTQSSSCECGSSFGLAGFPEIKGKGCGQ